MAACIDLLHLPTQSAEGGRLFHGEFFTVNRHGGSPLPARRLMRAPAIQREGATKI